MCEREVAITLKDKHADRIGVAKWILSNTTLTTSAKDAMYITDCMLRGETWRPNYFSMKRGFETCELFNVKIEEPVNPYAEHMRIQQGYYDLCRRGAEGDVEAALAYCKLEIEGKVSHGAMG